MFREHWLVLGLCALVVVSNPFGYRTALDHQGARLFSAYAGAHYGEGARGQTVVVLLQDRDLETLGQSWPMRYDAHADILRRIRGDTKPGTKDSPKPLALMIDFLFIDKGRQDPTLTELVDELARYQGSGIPVFLAIPLMPDPESAVVDDLRGRMINDPSNPPVLIERRLTRLVAVPRFVGEEQHNVYQFLLCAPIRAGTTEGCQWKPTAAAAIYDHICAPDDAQCGGRRLRIDEHLRGKHLLVTWGRSDPDERTIEATGCRFERFGERLKEALKDFSLTEMLYLDCPSTPTVSVTQLVKSEPSIAALFHGKVVFYGANLQGSADLVRPPLHGPLAGVYAHAMAFDNLRTYGKDYKREPRVRTVPLVHVHVPHDLAVALGSVTVIQFGLLSFGSGLRRRLLARPTWYRRAGASVRYVAMAIVWVVIVAWVEFHLWNHIPGHWLEIFLELVVGAHAAEMVAKFIESRPRRKPGSKGRKGAMRNRRSAVPMSLMTLVFVGALLPAPVPAQGPKSGVTIVRITAPELDVYDDHGKMTDQRLQSSSLTLPLPVLSEDTSRGLVKIRLIDGRSVWISKRWVVTGSAAEAPPCDPGRKMVAGATRGSGERCR